MADFLFTDGEEITLADPVVTPVTTQLYGETIHGRKKAILIPQGCAAGLSLVFYDSNDNPVELDSAEISLAVKFREALKQTRPVSGDSDAIEITDGANGAFTIPVPTTIADKAGIYTVEYGILDATNRLLQVDNCYLFINNSAWGSTTTLGPPTKDEIRMSMRDSDPVENELLGNLDFDLAEHCLACVQAVQFWNEQPPVLYYHIYDTRSFPFKGIWLLGIQSYLYRYAEEHYRRNQLPYSAGGTGVDDKNKLQQYLQAAERRYSEFVQAVVRQKVRLNLEGGSASLLSGYPR